MAETRVVDTSPLIYLARAELLDLLWEGAGAVLLPAEVAGEITAGPTADAAKLALSASSQFLLLQPEPIPPAVAAWDLGKGESAVLACGLARPECVLVIDDLAAQRCANVMGLVVRGTLGLVLRARKLQMIPSAGQALAKLRDVGMYLSDPVLQRALREIGE